MHWNQQVILSLLFYQASHEGRIYSLPKLPKNRVALRFRVRCVSALTIKKGSKGGLIVNQNRPQNLAKTLSILRLKKVVYSDICHVYSLG